MNQESEPVKYPMSANDSPESVSMNVLSVVLLGASAQRRKVLAATLAGTQGQVVREAALPELDGLPALLNSDCDVLMIDLDDEPERGLELVEATCASDPAITVMVCASVTDPELLVRCMRAGAREFLRDPISVAALTDALIHASVRRDEVKRQGKALGKCLVFIGAKGGSGTTTIASNFAVALTRETNQSVALLDLNLQFGDAALGLGLQSEFSALDALLNENRLDSDLISKLLVRHSSGLQVMAAPDKPNDYHPPQSAVMKLVKILRSDFSWIVVDAGAHYDNYSRNLFGIAEQIYLVTQVSVTELRNSNKIITNFFTGGPIQNLQVVLNRYAPRAGEIDRETIEKALTVAPVWTIPSDYPTVHRAQNEASALVMRDGSMANILVNMARAACGKRVEAARRKRFSLFS